MVCKLASRGYISRFIVVVNILLLMLSGGGLNPFAGYAVEEMIRSGSLEEHLQVRSILYPIFFSCANRAGVEPEY